MAGISHENRIRIYLESKGGKKVAADIKRTSGAFNDLTKGVQTSTKWVKATKNTMGEFRTTINHTRTDVKKFKMEYLGIMFGAMAINRVLRSFAKNILTSFKKVAGSFHPVMIAMNKLQFAWQYFAYALIDAMSADIERWLGKLAKWLIKIAETNPNTLRLIGKALIAIIGIVGIAGAVAQYMLLAGSLDMIGLSFKNIKKFGKKGLEYLGKLIGLRAAGGAAAGAGATGLEGIVIGGSTKNIFQKAGNNIYSKVLAPTGKAISAGSIAFGNAISAIALKAVKIMKLDVIATLIWAKLGKALAGSTAAGLLIPMAKEIPILILGAIGSSLGSFLAVAIIAAVAQAAVANKIANAIRDKLMPQVSEALGDSWLPDWYKKWLLGLDLEKPGLAGAKQFEGKNTLDTINPEDVGEIKGLREDFDSIGEDVENMVISLAALSTPQMIEEFRKMVDEGIITKLTEEIANNLHPAFQMWYLAMSAIHDKLMDIIGSWETLRDMDDITKTIYIKEVVSSSKYSVYNQAKGNSSNANFT